ncbi:metallophosphoesterase [Pseudoalteromonas sp. C2R02]|uniref:pre-peptidase C-terminal domain-containing protein n=1 Tax=Pseudoalteromonas sp. C2R02 TaxID=2841565 RepID=UPI001C0842F2|nr:pre-peptidase C-terminal domain-containing protein [Pseudoalteromonas sp. C2R02]MBU2970431.1 metallophosphoesterase [Pseudoalteromonas sp. C2R02]
MTKTHSISTQTFNALLILLLIVFGLKSSASETTFAVIGDFGEVGTPLTEVSQMINYWDPDLILTLGDNDYENDYTKSVLPYFIDHISSNCDENRFFPTYGNHDWRGRNGYDEVFPCISEHYKFNHQNIEFFTINSDEISNTQIDWLETSLKASTAYWKIVFLHHSPYSSGRHGSNQTLQFDFKSWGADVVLSAHDHHYERINKSDVYYIVNGLGGRAPYKIENCCVAGSEFRYNEDNGALRFDVNEDSLRFRFYNRTNIKIDDVTIVKRDTPLTPINALELKNGQSIQVSAKVNTSSEYYFDLPSNAKNVVVKTYSGTGDVDLYVQYNNAPTLTQFDCRPWKAGNNETCDNLTTTSGKWYILLNAFSDFDNVNLLASWDN